MDVALLGFAVAAGLVAALNPCGFAMLPAYLTLVVLGDDGADGREQPDRVAAVGRALLATAMMALGFLLVFGAFGLVLAPLAGAVQRYLPVVTVLIGAALIALGIWLLTGRELTLLLPKPDRGAPTARLGSMFGYGVAYAIASLSCTIGGFLAVTSATLGTDSVLNGIVAFLAYGAGMALTVGVLAVAVALAGATAAAKARRLLPYVNRVSGGLLVLVGLYVGYYGIYELRLFLGGGSPDDPVIEAAGAIQQTLAGWVDAVGPLPLIAALLTLVVLAALTQWWRRARPRPRSRSSSGGPATPRR